MTKTKRSITFILVFTIIFSLFPGINTTLAQERAFSFASDLPWISSTEGAGWGVKRDLNVAGGALVVNTVSFSKGIGTHSFNDATPADTVIDITGMGYTVFEAKVGIDDTARGLTAGSVEFIVLLDGVEKARTQILTYQSPTFELKANIQGGNILTLRTTNGGDGNYADWANWADAKLLYPASFYVDNTNGNDNNDGLTTLTPWKTLSKVSATTFYNGDTINLKCGEVWNETLTLNGQGTGASPITVQSYGTGNKPKLSNNAYCVVSGTNVGGWTVKGLTVECTTTATMPSGAENNGIQFNYTQGGYSDINIIGNEVYGAGIDKSVNGIRIQSVFNYNYQNNILTNININDNVIHDVGWVGITTGSWDTTAQQDIRYINLYNNVNILRNTVYNTGCQGIPLRCTTNGNMKWNLVYNCGQFSGTGLGWGAVGIWCMLSSNIDIMFNEVYGQGDSNNGYDAGGFDIDWTCDNVDLWYNYAHDNEGPGIETMANNNCTIKYNKVSGNNCLTTIGPGQISLSAYTGNPEAMTGVNNLSVTNNLIFVNKANTVALSTNLLSAGTWANNTFSYNNIVYSNALTGVKVYNLTTNANITAANYNNIYSSTGTAFKGTKNGTTYTTLSAWRTGTSLDLNSVTARSETTAPSALTNLNGSQGTGLVVNLTWTASTDSGRGISHYNIYRSTVSTFTPAYTNMVGESTTTSFSDTSGLVAGTTYYYKVTAEDKCGNVGTAGSKTISVS